MSDLGLLSFYLGIEVWHLPSPDHLRQAHRRVGQAHRLQPSLHSHGKEVELSRDSTTKEVNATQYQCIMGSLRYLVHTRQDLAFVVGYISRFM
jgi:hypothetical protein